MEARRNLSRICFTALYSAQSFAQWSSRKGGEIRVHARINFGGRRWKMYVCWTYTATDYGHPMRVFFLFGRLDRLAEEVWRNFRVFRVILSTKILSMCIPSP